MGIVHMQNPDYDFSDLLGIAGVTIILALVTMVFLLIKCRFCSVLDIAKVKSFVQERQVDVDVIKKRSSILSQNTSKNCLSSNGGFHFLLTQI